MNEPRDEQSDRPTTERAAELGEHVGRFTSLALQRIESVVREGMSGQPSREPEPTETGAEPSGTAAERSATERAEEMLNGMGERLGQLVSLAGPRIRKFAALAREEAEDVWAEAQHMRRANDRNST